MNVSRGSFCVEHFSPDDVSKYVSCAHTLVPSHLLYRCREISNILLTEVEALNVSPHALLSSCGEDMSPHYVSRAHLLQCQLYAPGTLACISAATLQTQLGGARSLQAFLKYSQHSIRADFTQVVACTDISPTDNLPMDTSPNRQFAHDQFTHKRFAHKILFFVRI